MGIEGYSIYIYHRGSEGQVEKVNRINKQVFQKQGYRYHRYSDTATTGVVGK